MIGLFTVVSCIPKYFPENCGIVDHTAPTVYQTDMKAKIGDAPWIVAIGSYHIGNESNLNVFRSFIYVTKFLDDINEVLWCHVAGVLITAKHVLSPGSCISRADYTV